MFFAVLSFICSFIFFQLKNDIYVCIYIHSLTGTGGLMVTACGGDSPSNAKII